MIVAAVISLLAHFIVGAARSSTTVRAWWSTGLELTAFGAVVEILTFSIGMALGQIVLHRRWLLPFLRMRSLNNRDQVLLRDRLDFRLGERRKVRRRLSTALTR
jgi:hypothetical protein